MASLNLSMFWTYSFIILSLLVCILENGYALEGGDSIESHYLTVKTSSLRPSSICKPSAKGPNKRTSSLTLVDRHGPCSPQKGNSPTISQILSQDQSRVSLIQSRIALASKTTNSQTDSKVKLELRVGSSLKSSNYIVTVGLGTPKKKLSLVIDTGSDLTWTQCMPCPKCYEQKDHKFNPLGSSSYSNITCESSECKQLYEEATDCESNTCMYNMSYNDQTSSVGFLAKETLTLTQTDVFEGFLFGCGQHNDDNHGLYGKTAGILGLSSDELSFVSQTSTKYGKMFSYCLPSKSSSTGHLTFGKSGVSSSVKFIPVSNPGSLYSIDITEIYVGGTKLSISSTGTYSKGIVIDSGTVITRLPPATYDMLRVTFRQMMIKYPTADNLPLLDTCYNLSNYSSISVPKISFLFNGNVMVNMDQSGILFGDSLSQMCLAFSSSNDSHSGIFGNVQQKTLEVVYDIAGGKLGFGAGGCS